MDRSVAIVAYSFRLPGVNKDNLWQKLLEQKNLITEVHPSRWPKESFLHPDKRHPGTSYTFKSGSIGDISRFDAAFFGISPREATLMDPQQRLLLELAWEAFENGGVVPSKMRGSNCGVFIGISSVDYGYRLADDLAAIDSSTGTGNVGSIAANRISYLFDLHGPSIAMDTACSSSLVAFHQACQSIRCGEISQALAGGINLHLHPYGFISFSKASMLSKTGRCHVFDKAGDGYVRSEGAGLFLLKDLDQAIHDGDQILAVVAGSAVNTDGSKSGLTVPNYQAQADLMSRVYRQAGLKPDDIDYLEAHGTGTAVGDPIETHAIGLALGKHRKKPLPIGSIKSNMGHLESASGVAGLVKAVNCIEHRAVPATIGITEPNPNIRFDEWNIRAVTETQPLSSTAKLTVGVNSFGFGGANAHVILQSPSGHDAPQAAAATDSPPVLPLVFSAKTAAGLNQAALQLADFLANDHDTPFYDIAYTAYFRRERHSHEALIFAADAAEAAEQVKLFSDQKNSSVHTGMHLNRAQGPAFVYSGNGCQWLGMGKSLLEESKTFKRTIARIDRIFRRYASYSLAGVLKNLDKIDQYQHTEIAQPALFAVQVGITEILREHQIHPVAVAGHSVGEVAAAWAAGALSLADAVKVIYYRSHHQGKTKGQGQMSAVALGQEAAQDLLDQLALTELNLAGMNSRNGVTVAGPVNQLIKLETELTARNIFFKRLDLDYAFHSQAMDPIETGVRTDLASLKPKTTAIPYCSTVTGSVLKGNELNAEYWWHNIRKPVLFQQAVETILEKGINTFIEVGAHPVLSYYLKEALNHAGVEGTTIATLARENDSYSQLEASVAQTLVAGIDAGLSRWFPDRGNFVKLPNYPWQREKFWLPSTSESCGILSRHKIHPLLGYALPQHNETWENQLDTQLYPYLADHNVGGAIVFPGAGFIEMALAAATQQLNDDDYIEIEELEIQAPLLLNEENSKVVRFAIDASDRRFILKSREYATSSGWSQHLVGRILEKATGHKLDIAAPRLPERAPDFDITTHLHLTEMTGLDYGPAFQTIQKGWSSQNSAIGIYAIPESLQSTLDQYYLHPSLLDCAFQLVFQILKDEIGSHEGVAFVPTKMGRIHLRADKQIPHLAQATLTHRSPHSLCAEFTLFDAEGKAIAFISDARFRAVKLHKSRTQQLHYLNEYLTAAPLTATAGRDRLADLEHFNTAFKLNLETNVCLRYSEEIEPLLDSLCNQFISEALQKLCDDDRAIPLSYVRGREETDPGAAELLRYLLSVATENQILTFVEDQGWVFGQSDAQEEISAADIWNTLIQDYPDYFYPIHLVGRVGFRLPELLNGDMQPDELNISPLLYAGITRHILGQTGKKVIAETLIQQCGKIIESQSPGERLSIIEISAGHPEFAELLCPHVDFNVSDYTFFGINDEALHHAESLREHYPLLQAELLPVTDAEVGDEADAKRANLAIINLNAGNTQTLQQLFQRLPKQLLPGSPVFIVGQQPAWWIDVVLGISPDWWLKQENNSRLSPQLSTELINEQLNALGFGDTTIFELAPGSYSGTYLITTRTNHADQALPVAQQNWLILSTTDATERDLAGNIADLLAESGQRVAVLQISDGTALVKELQRAQANSAAYDQIIHLSHLASADVTKQTERCALAAELIKACEQTQTNATCWLMTRNVGATFHCDRDAADFDENTAATTANDAALWGFGRSLLNESTNYRIKLLDTCDVIDHPAAMNALIAEFLHGDSEQEVFVDAAGQRFTPRLRMHPAPDSEQQNEENQTLRLGFRIPGQLRNLQWQSFPAQTPIDDDIEVEVKATGLNFRDVMYTLGLLSDEAIENGFAGPTLGLEFAGIVTRTGKLATEFAPGDHVVGFGPASFSNRVITKASAITHIPKAMPYAAAATIPGTFFTVYYALHYLARLQPGEKILIHGAAGGVGIAAIQIAQWLGAEIYATAGSVEKRDFLRLMGVEHIHDSRSLSFAEEILEKTNNRGIDVVLNSLAGEAINRNLEVLKPFGRFLELGKRDFYENTRIGLRPFRNNISYFGIDADQLMQERPELTRQLFEEMMQLFLKGILHPLPYTTFAANQVIDAFRYMQLAKHIGKIVVTYDDGIHTRPTFNKIERGPLKLSAEASYLVTGGLNGLGLKTAEWLVEKGARNLILIGRSGAASEPAKEALESFARRNINVHAAACDVCDKAALKSLLHETAASMPPLSGIIHSAAVIDDALVRNLGKEQIRRVLEPKILGAQNLHELTLDTPLAFFVVYSSVTTLLGNPGQSNYVAANQWLEAFAMNRRRQGLTATCIRFGAIDDVGFLARNDKIKEAMQNRMGGKALTSQTALNVLEQMILADSTHLGVMEFEWHALSKSLPTAASSKFREIALQAADKENDDENHSDIQRLLDELSDEELKEAFIDILKKELSEILLIAEDKLDPDSSMYDMGLDSLMGVELVVAIESRFDVQIPVMALSEGPTLNKLADKLVAHLRGGDEHDAAASDTEANIAGLSSRHGAEVTPEQISQFAKHLHSDEGNVRLTHEHATK